MTKAEYMKEWRATNPTYGSDWWSENPSKKAEYRERRSSQGLCIECEKPAVVPGKAGRCEEHRKLSRISSNKAHMKSKNQCYDYYGRQCVCCGETEEAFLTIDHIDGNGAEHRKTIGGSGGGIYIYRWLIRNNFPPGFQILCWNCQWGKQIKGVCPHRGTINGKAI